MSNHIKLSTGMNNLLNNKWAWAVVILVIINFASIGVMWATLCRSGHHMRPDHMQHMGYHSGGPMNKGEREDRGDRDFLAQALNLTPEQKVAFKKLKEEHFKAMESNRKEIGALRKEVIEHLGKPESEVEPTFQKIGALEIKNQEEAFKHFSEMYALCTDSQKVLLKEKLSNVMNHPRPGNGASKNNRMYGHKKGMHGKQFRQCKQHTCTPPDGEHEKANK